jgi:starvation-inducible DNA-binding protein
MEEIIAALKTLLADVVSFKFRVHGAHWNVEGKDFREYHDFFKEIYTSADESIDPIAEFIRKFGDYAPFTLPRFVELRTIQDSAPTMSDELTLAADVYMANQFILAELLNLYSKSEAVPLPNLSNFLAERIDAHQQFDWQLRASLKNFEQGGMSGD